MGGRKGIPQEVKEQVEGIVEEFNRRVIGDPNIYYVVRYRGAYLYLDRVDYGRRGPVCRLRYTGRMDGWEFAIYKYSDERYDAEEWFFPGAEYVDGTVEGAMRAGLEAYPP